MSPYQQFVFAHSRNVNLTGLTVVIVWLAVLFEFDALVLPESLVPFATIVRYGILIPQLLVALLLCYRQQYKWFTYITTSAVLTFSFWWHATLISLDPVPMFGLFTATVNVLIGCSLLFALPLKVHLFCLSFISTGVITALFFSSIDQPKQSLIFALGTGGTIALLTHGVVLRDRRYRALYKAIQASSKRLESRTKWNNFISRNVNDLNHTRTTKIHALLQQLSKSNSEYRFLNRALDCLTEINSLMKRFSSQHDWSRFSHPGEHDLFSAQDHLLGLLAELQIKHPDVRFKINMESDFQCQMEKGLFTRLLVNLLENAIRASSPETAILVEINKDNVISIENHGPPLELPLSELIKPGQQSGNPGKFGLGLYVCSKICKANGLQLVGRNTKRGVRMAVHFAPSELVMTTAERS